MLEILQSEIKLKLTRHSAYLNINPFRYDTVDQSSKNKSNSVELQCRLYIGREIRDTSTSDDQPS